MIAHYHFDRKPRLGADAHARGVLVLHLTLLIFRKMFSS
jgi:hypothetical protein